MFATHFGSSWSPYSTLCAAAGAPPSALHLALLALLCSSKSCAPRRFSKRSCYRYRVDVLLKSSKCQSNYLFLPLFCSAVGAIHLLLKKHLCVFAHESWQQPSPSSCARQQSCHRLRDQFLSFYVSLLALVAELNCRCFLCTRCSTEKWCPDEQGRDSRDWVGPPTWERA